MKFCAKCGTQLSDDINVCPQCQTPTDSELINNFKKPKKKFNKMFIITPLIVIITSAIVFSITYFVIPKISNANEPTNINPITDSANSTETSIPTQALLNDSKCPEDDYGYHSWGSATCEHPAICNSCGAYKDNKLGHHDFELDEDTGLIQCWHCNMLKEDYDKQNETAE